MKTAHNFLHAAYISHDFLSSVDNFQNHLFQNNKLSVNSLDSDQAGRQTCELKAELKSTHNWQSMC